eukprot:jgi/Chlat1/2727/Chrsp182S08757
MTPAVAASTAAVKEKLTAKEKKQKRKQALLAEQAELNAAKGAIAAAYAKANLLAEFAAFSVFERSGLALKLELKRSSELNGESRSWIMGVLETNMAPQYAKTWQEVKKLKAREMVEGDALYIVARDAKTDERTAFAQFRFVIEEDIEVLYVYELQLMEDVLRKGLGRHLMMLMELLARKNAMRGVMLTVQKRNAAALAIYERMGYTIADISPSKCDPLAPEGTYNYEILCKIHDAQAGALLVSRGEAARSENLSFGV